MTHPVTCEVRRDECGLYFITKGRKYRYAGFSIPRFREGERLTFRFSDDLTSANASRPGLPKPLVGGFTLDEMYIPNPQKPTVQLELRALESVKAEIGQEIFRQEERMKLVAGGEHTLLAYERKAWRIAQAAIVSRIKSLNLEE